MVMVKAFAPIKEASGQDAPNATEAMHRAGIYGVVDLQLLQQHGRSLVHKATNQANTKSTATLHAATAGGDGHQARQDAIAEAADVILLCDGITQEEDRDATGGSGQRGVHCHLRGQGTRRAIVHAQCGPRIEAVPAKPQCEGAKHDLGFHTQSLLRKPTFQATSLD